MPSPGKFLGQVVTSFQSKVFFILDVVFAGLFGVPLSPHDDKKLAAVKRLAVFSIFLLEIFFL